MSTSHWEKIDGEWQLVEDQAVAEPPAPHLPLDGRRQCRTCGVVKTLDLFRVCKGGRSRHCRACDSAKGLQRYHKSNETKLVTTAAGGYAITAHDAMHQLAAACFTWSEQKDAEDRRFVAGSVIYRARQLLAAVEGKA
jgi:hypothetical protein